jgi:hypothetical protein
MPFQCHSGAISSAPEKTDRAFTISTGPMPLIHCLQPLSEALQRIRIHATKVLVVLSLNPTHNSLLELHGVPDDITQRLSGQPRRGGNVIALGTLGQPRRGGNVIAQGSALGPRTDPCPKLRRSAIPGLNTTLRPFGASCCGRSLPPRALPWAITLRPFGAPRIDSPFCLLPRIESKKSR